MLPGGLTEAISYFAGYLHVFDDIARERDPVSGAPNTPPDQDYTLNHPQDDARPNFDDMQVAGVPGPDPGPDEFRLIREPFSHFPKISWPGIDDQPFHPVRALPPVLYADGGTAGGGGGRITVEAKLTYQHGGAQSLMEFHQYNNMVNNDNLIGSSNDMWLQNHLGAQTAAVLDPMIHQVEAVVPASWNMPQDDSGMIGWALQHDNDTIAAHGSSGSHSVGPGYYLNGVTQNAPPDALNPTLASPLSTNLIPDTGHGLGQWADVGNNHTVNAAQIIDTASSSGTTIVLGNFFQTDAIFQINAYANHNHIDQSSGPNAIQIDPNQTTNAAGFIQHEGVYASQPASFGGTNWSIDVVNGDYYNVHSLIQTNYLSNNDVVMQSSADTHYDVVTGANQLANFAEVLNGSFQYDLIIVGGSYHGFNAIYQQNLLVNNDTISSSGNGVDPAQSVSAGGNQLTNAATIDNYGDQSFNPISSEIQQIVDAIGKGATSLDPALSSMLNGYGGTLHVLYVTGDYYNVNAIWQTNLIADSNYVSQNLSAPDPGVMVLHPDGTETQSVTSGHDMLLNDASIVVAGSTQAYVGGQVYGDMVLIQANLLPHDGDPGASPTPQSFATELVAFLTDTPVHDSSSPVQVQVTTNSNVPTTTTTTVHDDPMSHMMH